MSELLDKLSSDHLVLLCVIMSIIALFLAIAISIEVFSTYRKKKKVVIENKEENQMALNIKEDENITYVEEDSELEKTKAKLELEKLKEQLAKEEMEKAKLLELNLKLATQKEAVTEPKEEDTPSVPVVTVIEEVKEEPKEVDKTEEVNLSSVSIDEEEENAIISYDELKQATNFGYTDEEMDQYVDEKDAIISMEELERLYRESNEIKEVPLTTFEFKKVEDLPKISEEKKFQSTPFISPVYGIGTTEKSISLEQTANLEKLNEEIKKTNEFLKALKELRKNLQ